MAETNKLSRAQRQELLDRIDAGETYASIARDFGVSLPAISFHARKAWGPKERRKLSLAQSEEIAVRFERGETVSALAQEFGVSLTTVRAHIETRSGAKPGRNRKAVGVTPPLSPCELAYLAALVDGEGCISKNRSGRHQGWQVTITNTSEQLRDSLSTLGGRFYFPKRDKSTRRGKELREQVWVWKTAAAWDVHRFLTAIEPFMRIKREKALRTMADIEAKHGAPPRADETDLRSAAFIIEESLVEAIRTNDSRLPTAPPLRAGQLRLGL